jgi:U3 small nucleolar RNA-associated protein 14
MIQNDSTFFSLNSFKKEINIHSHMKGMQKRILGRVMAESPKTIPQINHKDLFGPFLAFNRRRIKRVSKKTRKKSNRSSASKEMSIP